MIGPKVWPTRMTCKQVDCTLLQWTDECKTLAAMMRTRLPPRPRPTRIRSIPQELETIALIADLNPVASEPDRNRAHLYTTWLPSHGQAAGRNMDSGASLCVELDVIARGKSLRSLDMLIAAGTQLERDSAGCCGRSEREADQEAGTTNSMPEATSGRSLDQ